jgi:hypothetical protein
MADNVTFQSGTLATPPAGTGVATDKVTHSGDADQDVQLMRPVHVTGAEGSKTPVDITSADGLLVNLGANNDVTVTGTVSVTEPVSVDDNGGSLTVDGSVTANAGTNLNTSALALETGGNLAGAATSLAAIDDWDESDRAKVNPIAGQAGVQGGAGTVSANTQRVAIATDANAVSVSGVSTLAEQQTQTGHLATIAGDTTDIETAVELLDDAVHTDNQARGKSLLIGAVLDDASTTAITENQAGFLRMSSDRRLLVDGSGVTQPVSGTVSVTEPVSIDDNGASITVDGTVTANAGSGPFPVSDNAGSLTVDAPTGTPVNVQIGDGSLQATVRNTGSSDSLNVAIVDASGNQITGFGGGTEYDEDTAHSSGDKLTLAGVVQQTADSALSSDGDRSLLQVDSSGFLKVNVKAGSAGATEYTEDAASAANPQGGQVMARRRDALSGETTTDGDVVALNSTDKGELYVKHVDAIPVTDNAGSLTVDGTVTANLAAGSNNIGDVDVLTVPAPLSTTGGGTEAAALRVTLANDSTGVVSVDDNGSSLTVDGTVAVTGVSTLAEQQTQTTHLATIAGDTTDIETAVELIDDTVATLGTTTYTETTTKGLVMGAVRRDADTTLVNTTNEVAPLQVDANGRLKVEAFSGEALPITDNSGSLTVDGTVDIGSLPNEGQQTMANSISVAVASNQSAIPVSQSGTWDEVGIHDSGNSITVDAPAGTPVNVQVGDGSNTATIRNLAANDALNVALVDGAGDHITSIGGGVQYTEADTDASITGTAMLWEDTSDTLRAVSAAKPLPVGDAGGSLTVDGTVGVSGTVAVTQSGTWDEVGINDSGNSITVDDGGGSLTVDGTFTAAGDVAHDDADSGNPVKIGGRADTTLPAAVADGDRVDAWFNERGALSVQITDQAGIRADVSSGAIFTGDGQGSFGDALYTLSPGWLYNGTNWDRARGNTSGAFAQGPAAHDAAVAGNPQLVGFEAKDQDGAALPNAVNAEGDIVRAAASLSGVQYVMAVNEDGSAVGTVKLDAGTNNIGDVDVLSIAAGDNNIGNVDVVTMPNVTLAAGTNTNEVVGDVAHDNAAAGNPLPVAAIAQDTDDTAPPNAVSAEGDVVRIAANRDGAQFALPHGPRIWSYHENSSSALTDTSVKGAPGSGLSLYVTDIVISNGSTTALNVFFEEGSTTILGPFYLEAVNGRGLAIQFRTPKKCTANTALTVTTSAAVAHSIEVLGYTAAG